MNVEEIFSRIKLHDVRQICAAPVAVSKGIIVEPKRVSFSASYGHVRLTRRV